jgi:hypothetical protein
VQRVAAAIALGMLRHVRRDRRQRGRILRVDLRGRARGAVAERGEEVVHACHDPLAADQPRIDIVKAGVRKRRPAVLLAVDASARRRRLRRIERAMRADRIKQKLPGHVAVRPRPHRKRGAAARREHAVHLGERRRRARDVMHAEIRNDGVEASVRIGQRLGVALGKFDARLRGARNGQHGGGEINAGDARAARGGRAGHDPRPAAHVEHARVRANARGLEQRLDESARRRRERRAVIRGDALPTRMFERADAVGIEVHRTHS